LAFLYSLCLSLPFGFIALGGSFVAIVLAAPLLMAFGLTFGLLIGALPATILGSITAFVINWFIDKYYSHLSPEWAFGLGAAIASCGATLVGAAFLLGHLNWPDGLSPIFSFSILIGFPSVVYIIASGFLANNLLNRKKNAENAEPDLIKSFKELRIQ
jgi:hypothetical protein